MKNLDQSSRANLVILTGPTGSGKSALALAVAGEFAGEIVNFDSVQLYRGLDTGTAKTPLAERRGIAHHLLDVLNLTQSYSAGEYARKAGTVLAEVSARGRLPVLVGGTGFYLTALLEGLPQLPGRDETLRSRLAQREVRRPGSLHRLLRRVDPESAAHIHCADAQKVMRALEIRILTGKPRKAAKAAGRLKDYARLTLGLDPDRKQLRERLRVRTEAMFSEGILDEVRRLLATGATGREKPFEALGYKQALQHLRGEITIAEAIDSTWIATCQYAKRQRTWFRRDPSVVWLRGFGDAPETQREALAQVRRSLK